MDSLFRGRLGTRNPIKYPFRYCPPLGFLGQSNIFLPHRLFRKNDQVLGVGSSLRSEKELAADGTEWAQLEQKPSGVAELNP